MQLESVLPANDMLTIWTIVDYVFTTFHAEWEQTATNPKSEIS
jgi:hypothetical protein